MKISSIIMVAVFSLSMVTGVLATANTSNGVLPPWYYPPGEIVLPVDFCGVGEFTVYLPPSDGWQLELINSDCISFEKIIYGEDCTRAEFKINHAGNTEIIFKNEKTGEVRAYPTTIYKE